LKTLVFWIFIIAAMAFMAGIEGADLPKWVWKFIAVIAVIYGLAKKDIDEWFNSENNSKFYTTKKQDETAPPQRDIVTQKPVPTTVAKSLPKIKLNESETHLSINEFRGNLMINCPHCGTEILGDAKRCYKCGELVWF
jgi:hypothetical protein